MYVKGGGMGFLNLCIGKLASTITWLGHTGKDFDASIFDFAWTRTGVPLDQGPDVALQASLDGPRRSPVGHAPLPVLTLGFYAWPLILITAPFAWREDLRVEARLLWRGEHGIL